MVNFVERYTCKHGTGVKIGPAEIVSDGKSVTFEVEEEPRYRISFRQMLRYLLDCILRAADMITTRSMKGPAFATRI